MPTRFLLFISTFAISTTVWASGVDSHRINTKILGTLHDLTHNGGCDNRIYSEALGCLRDLYVYLPPKFDRNKTYPLLIWLHGYSTDEQVFAANMVETIDQEISEGRVCPMIIAAPDGSLEGSTIVRHGSWYTNSERGRYQDYLLRDVVDYLQSHYPISQDRDQRCIAGFSMGGFGAFNLGMKNWNQFRYVAGISPALNLRYQGCCGKYMEDYSSECVCLRDSYSPLEVVGRFYGGLVKIRAWQIVTPVWGRGKCALERVRQHNPIELLGTEKTRHDQQEYFLTYGRKDEMNVDAMVESFLDRADDLKIPVTVRAHPRGNHSIPFMVSVLPELLEWISQRVSDQAAKTAAREISRNRNKMSR